MKRWHWVIGLVGLGAFSLILLLFALRVRSSERESNIRHNLRTLQLALEMYVQTHGGRPPASIEDLLSESEVKPEIIFGGPDEAKRHCMHEDNVAAADTRPSETGGPIFSYIDGESDGAYWVGASGDVLWDDF